MMGRLRQGFTMVEMLVVIAITIVLMGLLLGPLSQSFRLTARGRTMIAAQDNARSAMTQITRELQDAMVVYDGLPIYMYGYDQYTERNGRLHPDANARASVVVDPASDPQRPQAVEYRDAIVDLVLPRARYYCTRFDHYLNDNPNDPNNEVAPNQAIEDCPRRGHEGSVVEARPIQPLQPSGTRVRYFVALRQGFNPNPLDPTTPGGSDPSVPRYVNPLLFTQSGSDFNNPYVLYRAEFDPNPTTVNGRETANWQLPDGRLNPNFFYDANFSRNWKARTVAVISPQNTDMVRWVQIQNQTQDGTPRWMPIPMTRFGATAVESETLDPNKETLISDGTGGYLEGQVPMQYVADYGHWTGPVNDMTLPLPPGVLIGPTAPLNTPLFAIGPRFQIFDVRRGPGGTTLTPVYDSAAPAAQVARRRLFTWDSSRGIVNFALRADTIQTISATGGGAPDEVPYSFSLKRDQRTRELPMVTQLSQMVTIPGGFGSLLADPFLGETVRIVPGSELVQVRDRNDQPVRTFERAGWIGTARDQIVAQADLDSDQYVIDYSNGLIMFSDRDPQLAGLPVHVRYQMHTNKATDLVRVSYATRELMTVNVGLLQFEPGSAESQEIQLTNRLRLRNLSR